MDRCVSGDIWVRRFYILVLHGVIIRLIPIIESGVDFGSVVDSLEEHGDVEDEYPSHEHNDREDLENFCLYRNNSDFCPRTRNPIRPNSE